MPLIGKNLFLNDKKNLFWSKKFKKHCNNFLNIVPINKRCTLYLCILVQCSLLKFDYNQTIFQTKPKRLRFDRQKIYYDVTVTWLLGILKKGARSFKILYMMQRHNLLWKKKKKTGKMLHGESIYYITCL